MPLFRRFGRPGLLGLAARTAVVAGTATAVTGGMMRHQRNRAADEVEQEQYEAQQQQAQIDAAARAAVNDADTVSDPASRPAGAASDLVEELQKLGALHDQGLLSDAEFTEAKSKLLR